MNDEKDTSATAKVGDQLAKAIVGRQNRTVRLMVLGTSLILGLGVGGALIAFSDFSVTAAVVVGIAVALAIAVTTEIFLTLRTADVAQESATLASNAVNELASEKLLLNRLLSEKTSVVMKLESSMHNKLGKLKPEARYAILSARKILTALETRLNALNELPAIDTDEKALRRYLRISGPLEFPKRGQQEGKETELPPIAKAEWESVLII